MMKPFVQMGNTCSVWFMKKEGIFPLCSMTMSAHVPPQTLVQVEDSIYRVFALKHFLVGFTFDLRFNKTYDTTWHQSCSPLKL